MKWIRYFLLLSGTVIIIYGFIRDIDLITFGGVFLFVIGIMLNVLFKPNIKKK